MSDEIQTPPPKVVKQGWFISNVEYNNLQVRVERAESAVDALQAALERLLKGTDLYDSAWDQDEAVSEYMRAKDAARAALASTPGDPEEVTP